MIIKRPFLTEKSLWQASRGWYTFMVDPKANKHKIRLEVEKLYKVNVTAVRTAGKPGKTRRVGKKQHRIMTAAQKKAYVRLAPGQKIPAFEVSTEEKK